MADTKLSALSEISVPALEDLLYWVDDPSGTPASTKAGATRAFGLLNHINQFRLTLTSGTPVTTADVTAATSIYLTPYNGNKIAIYDGTRWRLYASPELTFALGTLTSGLPYDLFVYDNAGTLTLEAAAWTNGTTRATALTTQDGVYVKTGATTRRYVGSFYTTSTTTTEDSAGGSTTQVGARRFLFNAYNRASRSLQVFDTADFWAYATSAWRRANGATGVANTVEIFVGLPDVAIDCALIGSLYLQANGLSSQAALAVGLNSDSAPAGPSGIARINTDGGHLMMTAAYKGLLPLGYSKLSWIENGGGMSGTVIFVGDNGASLISGITATAVV